MRRGSAIHDNIYPARMNDTGHDGLIGASKWIGKPPLARRYGGYPERSIRYFLLPLEGKGAGRGVKRLRC